MANFSLSSKEEYYAKKFKEKHNRCRPNSVTGMALMPFNYKLIPTGIGIAVKIICPYCKKEKDITDVECW